MVARWHPGALGVRLRGDPLDCVSIKQLLDAVPRVRLVGGTSARGHEQRSGGREALDLRLLGAKCGPQPSVLTELCARGGFRSETDSSRTAAVPEL